MSAAVAQNCVSDTPEGGHLSIQSKQPISSVIQDSVAQNHQTQASDPLSLSATNTSNKPAYLGDLDEVSYDAQYLAVTRCLNSVTGGNQRPWKAYPGHNRLITVDMNLNGTRNADQFLSTPCANADIKSWLKYTLQAGAKLTGKTHETHLKLLMVTLSGGETVSSSSTEDANVLRDVFDEWGFPVATLSILVNRYTTFKRWCTSSCYNKTPGGLSTCIDGVYCIGMKQWTLVWSAQPSFGVRGVIMCMDKTWASSVPGIVLQYLKTMWMFGGFRGILPLVACMASLRYAALALATDDREAFRREFELREWLKAGPKAERTDLGHTSAQVSWLSSRVSRQKDRLTVTNSVLFFLRDGLERPEVYGPKEPDNRLYILNCCIYDLIKKDSATALLIAKTSQTIATDSRRDQKVSVDIANSSRLIACNTLRDSASMKAIANVTMVFLPGTFMASVFAMPFFSSQKAAGFFVSRRIWIYVIITLPLTLATLACAWAWYHFSARSHRALQGEDNEETQQQSDRRPLEYPTQYQKYTPRAAEKEVGFSAYTLDKDRLDGSSQLDVNFEQEDYPVHNNEHWDPMTREFAPSVFAASVFAISDDSLSGRRKKIGTGSSRDARSTKDTMNKAVELTVPPTEEVRPYVCDTCHRPFSGPEALELHRRWQGDTSAFKCPTCEWSFASCNSLSQHQEYMHSAGSSLPLTSKYSDVMQSKDNSSKEQSPVRKSPKKQMLEQRRNNRKPHSAAEVVDRIRGRDPYSPRRARSDSEGSGSHAGYSC